MHSTHLISSANKAHRGITVASVLWQESNLLKFLPTHAIKSQYTHTT